MVAHTTLELQQALASANTAEVWAIVMTMPLHYRQELLELLLLEEEAETLQANPVHAQSDSDSDNDSAQSDNSVSIEY